MPSSDRRPASPTCQHFGTCGGCDRLTTAINEQRAEKHARVVESLAPFLSGILPTWTNAADVPPMHDRQRLLYPVQPSAQSSLTMGLYRRGSHEAIELSSCAIQDERLTELGRRALVVFRERRLQPYDEVAHSGTLRAFTARIAASTGELLIGLVTATERLPDAESLAQDLLECAADLPGTTAVGVVHNINERRGNALLGGESRLLVGRDHIFDEVAGDLRFRVGFASFYQLHRDADALLYRPALDMVGDVSSARVVDGYAGVGTFGLRLARAGAVGVQLVEANPSACADAEFNLRDLPAGSYSIHNRDFDAFRANERPDFVLVDPSRAGLLEKGQQQLRRLAAPRLLYVACGLKALARDLAALPAYRLVDLRLADLFPHTAHVEILALLERVKG